MKAVAYARFSSDMQREESIDAQFRAIEEYCNRENIILVGKFYDEGMSGTNDNRPQFQEMIKFAKSGIIDCVIVHKLDRFSRSKYDSAIYKRKLKDSGVKLISVLENIDGSPESIILESVLEGMNEYYSQNLSREVRKGLQENALKAQFNGGYAPLGYLIDENNKYVIEPYEAQIVKEIFDMYANGYSYGDMVKMTKEKGYKTKFNKDFKKTSFFEILRNEKYIGTYIYKKVARQFGAKRKNSRNPVAPENMIKIENVIPKIVDKSTWDKVQERKRINKLRYGENKGTRFYILSGLVYCGECDTQMVGYSQINGEGNKYFYYRCKHRGHPSIRAEKIEKIVLDVINENIFTPSNKEVIADSMMEFMSADIDAGALKALESNLKDINKQIDNIVNTIASGVCSVALTNRLNDLEVKKKNILPQISKFELSNNLKHIKREEIIDFLNKHSDINEFTPEEQSTILKMFVSKIIIYKDSINIKLKMIDKKSKPGVDGASRSGVEPPAPLLLALTIIIDRAEI